MWHAGLVGLYLERSGFVLRSLAEMLWMPPAHLADSSKDRLAIAICPGEVRVDRRDVGSKSYQLIGVGRVRTAAREP